MKIENLKLQLEEHIGCKITHIELATEGYQNIVAILEVNQKKLVARLSEIKTKSKNSLLVELNWLKELAENGVSVAKPIFLSSLQLDTYQISYCGSQYWVAIFEHTNGSPISVLNPDEWNSHLFYRWGRTIAKIHNTKINRQPSKHVENKMLNFLPDDMEKWLYNQYEQLILNIKKVTRSTENFGLIHNDLHQGNFHIRENEIVLFDFDDCCYFYYAQDIAVSIYHALWTGTSFHPEWTDFPQFFLTHFLKGYTSKKRLTEDMFEQTLLFLKLREVFLYNLFRIKWDENHLKDWQIEKIEELKHHIQTDCTPYMKEMREMEHYFSRE